MNQKPFQTAERDFFLLKGQLAANRLSRAQFDAALAKLNVRDEYGRAWRMEPETGAWQVQQDDTWIAADPKTVPAPPNMQNRTGANKLPLLVALVAILFFCVCGAGTFVLLNATGVITTQFNLLRSATPTFVALATPKPMTSATLPIASATLSPQPSPTLNDATATPFDKPTEGAAQPTTNTPATFTAFDADFFGDACPLFEGSNDIREYACNLGEYHMLHKQATTRYTYYDTTYDDAVIEANGYLIEGTGKYEYGIVFRANPDGTLYYVFTVTNDGKYNVALYKDNKYTDLIPYTASPAVITGTGMNFFKLVARGSKFDFYLNGQYLNTVSDSTIPNGAAGLFFYNAEPNTAVGFDQFTISTFTPPPPTATADADASPVATLTATDSAPAPTVAVKPGVYVSSLRFDPRAPKRGEPVVFLPTFVNATGKPQSFKWLVEIWEATGNKKNPYGQADARQQQIPPGTTELATGNSWKVAGGGPCIPFRARAVYEDDQTRRIPFKQTNGKDLWVNFQVCP